MAIYRSIIATLALSLSFSQLAGAHVGHTDGGDVFHDNIGIEEPDDPMFQTRDGWDFTKGEKGQAKPEGADGQITEEEINWNAPIDGDQGIFSSKPISYLGLAKGQLVLTIDDGPHKVTADILNLLRDYNIKATFFVIGSQVKNHVRTMRQMYDDGHVIANHTYTHNVRPNKNNLKNDVVRAHKAIQRVIPEWPGDHHGMYFRSPGLGWAPWRANILNSDQLTRQIVGPIHANIGTDAPRADWSCWSKRVSAAKCASWYVSDIVKKGRGIVLAHDLKSQTYSLLKTIFQKLEANGGIKNLDGTGKWEFVTLDQLSSLNKFRENGHRPNPQPAPAPGPRPRPGQNKPVDEDYVQKDEKFDKYIVRIARRDVNIRKLNLPQVIGKTGTDWQSASQLKIGSLDAKSGMLGKVRLLSKIRDPRNGTVYYRVKVLESGVYKDKTWNGLVGQQFFLWSGAFAERDRR